MLPSGSGKIGQALALDTTWCDHALHRPGGLSLHDGPTVERVAVGPRVGVDDALPEHRDLPWRFAIADSRWVSHRSRRRAQADD